MLTKILPSKFDNDYRGNKVALWVFYALTALTLWRSQHHLFAEDGGAQSIAGIPLDTFGSNASDTVVSVFALWGLSQLIVGLIFLLVCIRYKSAIPLMYLLSVIEYFVRFAYVGFFKPIETVGTAPGDFINLPFMVLFLVMCWLSTREPRQT